MSFTFLASTSWAPTLSPVIPLGINCPLSHKISCDILIPAKVSFAELRNCSNEQVRKLWGSGVVAINADFKWIIYFDSQNHKPIEIPNPNPPLYKYSPSPSKTHTHKNL